MGRGVEGLEGEWMLAVARGEGTGQEGPERKRKRKRSIKPSHGDYVVFVPSF